MSGGHPKDLLMGGEGELCSGTHGAMARRHASHI